MSKDLFFFDAAFGLVCRKIIPAPGVIPYETVGAGICVHPDGVVLTATHVVENLHRHLSPFDDEQLAAFTAQSLPVPADDHERAYFMFARSLCRGGGVQPWEEMGHPLQVFWIHHFSGSRQTDAGVVCLSPVEEFRPIPFILPRETPTRVGERALYLGHYHSNDAPKDLYGHAAGNAILYGETTIVACQEDFFLLDFEARQGMSGGPVVDPETGLLLGIITEVWPAAKSSSAVGIERPLTYAVSVSTCGPPLVQTLVSQGYDLNALRRR